MGLGLRPRWFLVGLDQSGGHIAAEEAREILDSGHHAYPAVFLEVGPAPGQFQLFRASLEVSCSRRLMRLSDLRTAGQDLRLDGKDEHDDPFDYEWLPAAPPLSERCDKEPSQIMDKRHYRTAFHMLAVGQQAARARGIRPVLLEKAAVELCIAEAQGSDGRRHFATSGPMAVVMDNPTPKIEAWAKAQFGTQQVTASCVPSSRVTAGRERALFVTDFRDRARAAGATPVVHAQDWLPSWKRSAPASGRR